MINDRRLLCARPPVLSAPGLRENFFLGFSKHDTMVAERRADRSILIFVAFVRFQAGEHKRGPNSPSGVEKVRCRNTFSEVKQGEASRPRDDDGDVRLFCPAQRHSSPPENRRGQWRPINRPFYLVTPLLAF